MSATAEAAANSPETSPAAPIVVDFFCMSCGHHFTSTTRCEHAALLARIEELEASLAEARAANSAMETA